MYQIRFCLGLRPDPAGGNYSAPTDSWWGGGFLTRSQEPHCPCCRPFGPRPRCSHAFFLHKTEWEELRELPCVVLDHQRVCLRPTHASDGAHRLLRQVMLACFAALYAGLKNSAVTVSIFKNQTPQFGSVSVWFK